MLAVMKKKASEAVDQDANVGSDDSTTNGDAEAISDETNGDDASAKDGNIVTSFDLIEGKPTYNAILSTLITVLKPASIKLTDKSSKESGESHFALEIVAEVFEGMELVKRKQLIGMLLGEVMPKIEALEIEAKSTSEV